MTNTRLFWTVGIHDADSEKPLMAGCGLTASEALADLRCQIDKRFAGAELSAARLMQMRDELELRAPVLPDA